MTMADRPEPTPAQMFFADIAHSIKALAVVYCVMMILVGLAAIIALL